MLDRCRDVKVFGVSGSMEMTNLLRVGWSTGLAAAQGRWMVGRAGLRGGGALEGHLGYGKRVEWVEKGETMQ